MFNYNRKIIATLTYKSIQKSVQVIRNTTIKQLKAKFEVKCNFNLGKFKLVHLQSASDLMLVNDNLNVIEHFGEEGLDNLLFEIQPREFTEQYYISLFEKEYFKEDNNSNNNITNSNNNNFLPNINNISNVDNKNITNLKQNIISSISNINNVKDDNKLDVCFWDKINRSTFICTKCRQEYCRECIKYEPHPQSLVEKSMIDSYCKVTRESYMKELNDKVTKSKNYNAVNRMDFILNDKVKKIEEQFDEIFQVLLRMKETQTKFLIDIYYQQVENKTYKALPFDIDYFNGKFRQIESAYKPGNSFINENLDNLKTLEKYKKLILDNYSDFEFKYDNFSNMFSLYNNFNDVLLNQLESKLQTSNGLRKQINNTELLKKEETFINNKKMKPTKSAGLIMKMSYYNSVSVFNNIKMSIRKEFSFEDKCDFRVNYQLYDGNIFLNFEQKLFCLTGSKFNQFFMYDYYLNRMFKFSDLKENHCRGVMINIEVNLSRLDNNDNKSVKRFILVIGGRINGRCELLDITNMKFSQGERIKALDNNKVNEQIPKNNEDLPSLDIPASNNDGKSVTSKFSKLFGNKKNNQPNNVGAPVDNIMSTSKSKKLFFNNNNNKSNINASEFDNYAYSNIPWSFFPSLNQDRNQCGVYYQNQRFVYVFFGINSKKGFLDTIERIDIEKYLLSNPKLDDIEDKYINRVEEIDKGKDNNNPVIDWEIVNFKNPKNVIIGLHSMGLCFLNPDEVLLIGGVIKDNKFSNKMLKYNLTHEMIHLSPQTIPDIETNEYYRFWEETNFLSLKDLSGNYNTNDDFYYGMFDAKNKIHLLNIKTFEYRILDK